MRYIVAAIVLVVALTSASPALASEEPVLQTGTSEHISRTVTTVTGVETLNAIIGQFDGVELGSAAATITLDVEGTPTPVVVEYGSLVGQGEDGQGGALVRYGALGLGAGLFLKFLGLLMRLGRA